MASGNRFIEAFKEQGNVAGLATAAALSAALLNPLPLLVGLVAEAAYLIFVPDSRWYEQRLAKRHDAEIRRQREALKAELLPTLRPALQERFARLEATREQISAQAAEGETWSPQVQRKLDYLLDKFLQFSAKEAQFSKYLSSVLDEVRESNRPLNPNRRVREEIADTWIIEPVNVRRGGGKRSKRDGEAAAQARWAAQEAGDRWVLEAVQEIQAHYDAEGDEVKQLLTKQADANTQAVLQKRLDVLGRRCASIEKIGRILINLNHQLSLLEDTFGLINDEIRARSPEQVLADIDDVVWQTESMTKLLEDVAPLDQMLSRLTP